MDGPRYWFSTQPSVARMADDRAAGYDRHTVFDTIVKTLRQDRERGAFAGVHIAPDGSAEVPDLMEARLVILGPEQVHIAKDEDSPALAAAADMLAHRGSSQRLYKNMLLFLAPDKQRLADLEQAVRLLKAWSSIVADEDKLNLDAFQRRQAETKKTELDGTVRGRIQETWVWALVPIQPNAQNPAVEWSQHRLQGSDGLAVRASKKLVQDEALMTAMGPARLKLVLDDYLWPSANHIGTRQLWEYLASYLYLPRLRDVRVLEEAIRGGIGQLVSGSFAYAGRYDEETGRYEGLRLTGGGSVVIDGLSVLVKPDVAKAQQDAEQPQPAGTAADPARTSGALGASGASDLTGDQPEPADLLPRRFFATVELSPDRAARDMGRVAEEVLQHLTTLPGAKVRVTVEIDAGIPNGAAEPIQRVVHENCQTLKFKTHGFERS